MSVHQYAVVIIVSAALGWIINSIYLKLLFRPHLPKRYFGFRFQGLIPAFKPVFAKSISVTIFTKYLSERVLEEKLSNPAILQKLKPELEIHIDHFLREKLPVTFPLLSKLMGEKTLLKFKEAFLLEVESSFPEVITNTGKNMIAGAAGAGFIEEEIDKISVSQIEAAFYKYASGSLVKFRLLGAAAGVFTGIIQCLILILLNN